MPHDCDNEPTREHDEWREPIMSQHHQNYEATIIIKNPKTGRTWTIDTAGGIPREIVDDKATRPVISVDSETEDTTKNSSENLIKLLANLFFVFHAAENSGLGDPQDFLNAYNEKFSPAAVTVFNARNEIGTKV